MHLCTQLFCIHAFNTLLNFFLMYDLQVFKDVSSEVAYYVSYLPLSEIDSASMSVKNFDTLAAVQKNAQKCTGFRKRLITVCQEEFRAAVCSVSDHSLTY